MKHKFILSIALLCTLVLMVSSSLAASASYTINAPITSGTKMTASQWYASAKSRAMLTISLSVDTISQMDDSDSNAYTSFWMNPSWVGISKSKNQVMVAGYFSSATSTTVLVMIYTPSTGKIEYIPVVSKPAMNDSLAEQLCLTALQNDSTGAYEKNDPVEILSIIADLQQ